MLKVESETGDLKELSDDEFLHLLKEASTFNKPNNQESDMLKQLRKEVAESDTCENASRSETGCVSKRKERKCSNTNDKNSQVPQCAVTVMNDLTPFPPATFKIVPQKPKKIEDVPICVNSMVINSNESAYFTRPQVAHNLLENDPGSDNWTLRRKKSYSSLSESSDHITTILSKNCENSEKNEQEICAPSKKHQYDLNSFTAAVCPTSQVGSSQKQNTIRIDSESSNSLNKAVPTLVLNSYDYLSNDNASQNHVEQLPSKGIQDIELTEFKRLDYSDHINKKQEISPITISKDPGCNELGSSKFYVNCSEVDSPVAYPLKFVSNPDERNGSTATAVCDPLNDQSKQRQMNSYYPLIRTNATPIIFNPGPVDPDSLQSDSDCITSRVNRGANLTSIVSATFLDYPNSTISSENQTSKLEWSHRKHKRTRNHADNTILAENIAGHRGNDDIDSLVKFIEAADKNDKSLSRNNPNHILSKSSSTPENFKRKTNGKEPKSNQNKPLNLYKKKLQVNEESSGGTTDDSKTDFVKNMSSESELSDDSYNNKNKPFSPDFGTSCLPLDINSNVMDSAMLDSSQTYFNKQNTVDMLDNSSSDLPAAEISSFASDFYSVTDAIPQAVEESGFRIVKKKQRKKHQGKRSENYRWHSAAARAGQNTGGSHSYYSKEQVDHSSGSIILLPGMTLSQRGQCGNQDSRRKSTSSVPHSEQSSADNSDLDSVHSLPVRGSAPHPTKAHPHTTPSSSSSTPQASYADIARMPVSVASKLSPSVAASGSTPPVSAKCIASDKNQCNFENWLNTSSVSNPAIFTECEIVEEAAIKSSDLISKSTREINTQTEPLISCQGGLSLDSNSNIPVHDLEKSVCSSNRKTVCTSFSCRDKTCACIKEDKLPASQPSVMSKSNTSERTQRPAVVMMGNIPTTEASDISFGIDLKEILQISLDQHTESGVPDIKPRITDLCNAKSEDHQLDTSGIVASVNDREQPCTKADSIISSLNADISKLCDRDQDSTFRDNSSSPYNELFLLSGQKLQFKECTEVDTELFNYKQIVELVAREWKNVHKEYCNEMNKNGDKVKYYENSC